MTYIFLNLGVGGNPDRPNWPIHIFIPESRYLLNLEEL